MIKKQFDSCMIQEQISITNGLIRLFNIKGDVRNESGM